MDMKRTSVSFLNPVLIDSKRLEQNQEIRIPEAMPDADKVLGVWGQPVLRGKEWRADTVGFNGGMMLWILYRPEGEGQTQVLDAWVPFQAKWELPENTPEGKLISCMGIRFLDARIISPRKIMVRCGSNVTMQAFSPSEKQILFPENLPEDVMLLKKTFPLRLYAQAGEKAFALEDHFSSAGEDINDWKIASVSVRPYVNDQKVVGNKIAFRGAAEMTVLFLTEGGVPESRKFVFPFSQFAEMEDSFGNDADAELQLCVTNLELEEDPEGEKRFKLGLTAQYSVSDVTMLETVSDAYSNIRRVEPSTELLDMMPIAERKWESISGRIRLPEDVTNTMDASLWLDAPVFDSLENGGILQTQGSAQILTNTDTGPEGRTLRWEGSRPFAPGENTGVFITAVQPGQIQTESASGSMELTGETRCLVTTHSMEGIPMITNIELGEPQEQNPDRPSLILCSAENKTLWELAKENGSTVEAIQNANALEGEPKANQMLLIPIV